MKQAIFQKQRRRAPIGWFFVVFLLNILAVALAPSAAVAEEVEIQASVSPSVFTFETTIPDDGKGDGGGWQEAKAKIPISDPRGSMFRGWICKIHVEMPLRTKANGSISADRAAKASADVATKAWKKVMPRQPPGEWAPGAFCVQFRAEMETIFAEDKKYKTFGARVKTWN
jgi:hypothetical protein